MSIKDAISNVLEFHRTSGIPELEDRGERAPSLYNSDSRMALIREEMEELEEAIQEFDVVKAADAYADLIYVILGSAIVQVGVERFIKIWDEVQRTNMAKFPNGKATFREDGKILKPPGWQPPRIEEIIEDRYE